MYKVNLKKKIIKNINKMPLPIQKKLANLIEDLQIKGPFRSEWPNYSKIAKNEYHCHLSHKWVACWQYENKSVTIEVYYAGSRENSPY